MAHRLTLFLLVVLLAGCIAHGQALSVAIDPLAPARLIPEDFAGFSYETAQLLPRGTTHYFSPGNKPLVSLFKTLGVRSLRIGGNSVDRIETPIPTEADIDSLFAFARAAGVRVIYTVRLKDGEPASAAAIAGYIQEHYADALDCFAIGNEPQYFKTWPEYREKWKAIVDAMLAAAPGAKICAPDTNPNPEWCRNLVSEFGKSAWFVMIGEHDYPGGCAYKNPFHRTGDGQQTVVTATQDLVPVDAVMAREKMLSTEWYKRYAEVRGSMVDAVIGTSIPFRLTETNNFWFGGLADASDTYASALWGVDYLYWWAAHDARGINFHTGDNVGGGSNTVQSRYTAFVTAEPGFDVRPLSYGLKLFDLGGHGKLIPIRLASGKDKDLAVYATMSDDKTLAVTIINKSHGAAAADSELKLELAAPCVAGEARILFLSAPNGDIAVKTGIILGNAPIQPDGTWAGQWTALKIPAEGNIITLRVPPATAAIVKAQLRVLPAPAATSAAGVP